MMVWTISFTSKYNVLVDPLSSHEGNLIWTNTTFLQRFKSVCSKLGNYFVTSLLDESH